MSCNIAWKSSSEQQYFENHPITEKAIYYEMEEKEGTCIAI